MNHTVESLKQFEEEIIELYLDCQLPFLFHLSGGNEKELMKTVLVPNTEYPR